jgi:cytochrome c5
MSRWWTAALVGAAASAALVACKEKKNPSGPEPTAAPSAKPAESVAAKPTSTVAAAAHAQGDVAQGKALVERFECNRCHEGTGMAAPKIEKDCVACHVQIMADKFPASAAKLAEWKPHVRDYEDVPSLAAMGARGKPESIVAFLEKPHDLRPHLVPTMPRLAITRDEAAHVAAYLTRNARSEAADLDRADATNGRSLIESKNCGSCHEFGGVAAFPTRPKPGVGARDQQRAVRLAPDLRWARDRWAAGPLVAWLLDPASLKPGTLMPTHNFTPAEARDVAKYLLETEFTPPVIKAVPQRLPVLTRPVKYAEVVEKVVGITCRHCHGEADIAMGDGGPGNTGGFGFKPRGLNLATYETTNAGILDAKGERNSVFMKLADGTPHLVRSLIARQKEEAGEIDPEVRGMPIGLPALSAEQVQIVESWVAQGRPR